MNKTPEFYDKILRTACDPASHRLHLHEPHPQNNFVYASESHLLIRIAKDVCLEYSEHEGQPNYEVLFPETPLTLDKTITINEINEATKEITIEYQYQQKDCPDCGGDGEITCEHCEHEHECDRCKGSGTLPDTSKAMNLYANAPEGSVQFTSKKIQPICGYILKEVFNLMEAESAK